MSLAALIFAVGANAIGAIPVPLDRPGFLELPAPTIRATGPVEPAGSIPSAQKDTADEQSEYPQIPEPDASQRPDLVVHLGDRRTWPQLELGALGGGTQGFQLLHVGLGFDF